jgi:hypothetical protein
VIYDYDIATYFEAHIYVAIGVTTIILLLSYSIGLLMNWGLKDGNAVRRIIRLQLFFSILFLLFWMYHIYQIHKEQAFKEQTINECIESNIIMVTIPYYTGAKADSVFDVMKNITDGSAIVDSDFTSMAIASQLLDKKVKSDAIADIDTIYCIEKTDVIPKRVIKNTIEYRRELIFEYTLTRKNTYYRAKYLWNSDECILDTLFQLH